MGERAIIAIEKTLVKRARAKAEGRLVTLSRYVNELIRADLLGMAEPVRETPKTGKVLRGKGCDFCDFKGVVDLDFAMDTCPTPGHPEPCNVCHDCPDQESVEDVNTPDWIRKMNS